MRYFYLEPEVAGGIAEKSVADLSVRPPLVSRLHYTFDGWLGGAILASLRCFIVTLSAQRALEGMGATGIKFDSAETSKSELFKDLYPDRQLPEFVWLKVYGTAGKDDLGIAPDRRLVVSQRVLDLFDGLGLSDAVVEPFGRE
jgi:hypothetical protein